MMSTLTVACAPDVPPVPTFSPLTVPRDIDQMSEQQLDDTLGYLAPDLVAGLTDPSYLASVPADVRVAAADLASKFSTAAGRAGLAVELRELSRSAPHGTVTGVESVDTSQMTVDGGVISTTPFASPGGVRSDVPSGAGTQVSGSPVGFEVAFGPDSSAPCRAPGGVGSLAAPADLSPGQLITPQHDVFTQTSWGIGVGSAGPLSVTGQEPVPGKGAGIEFRGGGFEGTQQMHVQVNLDDPKDFGPSALGAIITIRRLGDVAANEYRPALVDPHVYCYAGDQRSDRGYLDAWIAVPRTEPGFQVIAEVVENDAYFGSCPFGPNCDFFLSFPGPDYWAGADRSTVHAGAPAVTSAGPIANAAGAFVSSTPDVGATGSNVITDTNGNPSDDIESALGQLLDSTIRTTMNGVLSNHIVDIGVVEVGASLRQSPNTQIDLRFSNPQDGRFDFGEPAGPTGSVRADVGVDASLSMDVTVLGLICRDMKVDLSIDLKANAWADSGGKGTEIVPRFSYERDIAIDSELEGWQHVNPTCILASVVDWLYVNDFFVEEAFDRAVSGVFYGPSNGLCVGDPTLFANGQLINPYDPLPEECRSAGILEELVGEIDLNDVIPAVTLGSTTIAPVVTDINNSWCATSTAPAGCSGNQDLLGVKGPGVVVDAALVSSLGDALGAKLAGRFRNVFRPTTTSSVNELVTSHRTASGTTPGLGVVVDPALVNLSLRHLSQGGSTTRDTNGILDQSDIALPVDGWSVSTRPEVAPVVTGIRSLQEHALCDLVCPSDVDPATPLSSPFVGVLAPDVRLSLDDGPGAPIEFSLAASVEASVVAGPGFSSVRPQLGTTTVDLLVTGGCQVDYGSGYGLSYRLCGRGRNGSGIASDADRVATLAALINYAVNGLVVPLVTDSFGSINLPAISRVVPSANLALTNVEFSLRGGFLGVYADVKKGAKFSVMTSVPPLAGVAHFERCCVDNIDLSLPTTYRWEVKDLATGAVVTTGVVDPADGGKLDVPLSSFTPKAWPDGSYGIRGHAQLTITQAGLEVGSGGIVNVHRRNPDDEPGPICPPEGRAIVC